MAPALVARDRRFGSKNADDIMSAKNRYYKTVLSVMYLNDS